MADRPDFNYYRPEAKAKPQCECLRVLGDIAEALALEGQKEKADAVFEAVGQLRIHNILREHLG